MNMSTVTPTLEQMINIKLDERNNENKHMDAMLNVKKVWAKQEARGVSLFSKMRTSRVAAIAKQKTANICLTEGLIIPTILRGVKGKITKATVAILINIHERAVEEACAF